MHAVQAHQDTHLHRFIKTQRAVQAHQDTHLHKFIKTQRNKENKNSIARYA
jgi:hypothetical protein